MIFLAARVPRAHVHVLPVGPSSVLRSSASAGFPTGGPEPPASTKRSAGARHILARSRAPEPVRPERCRAVIAFPFPSPPPIPRHSFSSGHSLSTPFIINDHMHKPNDVNEKWRSASLNLKKFFIIKLFRAPTAAAPRRLFKPAWRDDHFLARRQAASATVRATFTYQKRKTPFPPACLSNSL